MSEGVDAGAVDAGAMNVGAIGAGGCNCPPSNLLSGALLPLQKVDGATSAQLKALDDLAVRSGQEVRSRGCLLCCFVSSLSGRMARSGLDVLVTACSNDNMSAFGGSSAPSSGPTS